MEFGQYNALEIERIAVYFHSPAVLAQLLFIFDGRQWFVDVRAVCPAPVCTHVVDVMVVVAAGRATRHVSISGGLLGHPVA